LRRANRSRRETTTAVGANVEDYALHAIGAKGAFVGADARIRRSRRQRFVAVFAGGAEFEHTSRAEKSAVLGHTEIARNQNSFAVWKPTQFPARKSLTT
jgi:hypothetical protein